MQPPWNCVCMSEREKGMKEKSYQYLIKLITNKAGASQQNISTALLSASKHKSYSKEHIKEEGMDNGLGPQDY